MGNLMAIENMTANEIKERIITVMSDMNAIRSQLNAAKVNRIETGEYANADWFRKATDALKHKGREHQELQFALGRLSKEQSKEQTREFQLRKERFFIETAKELLDEKTYSKIWDIALSKLYC